MNAPLHRELPPTVLDSATALAQVTHQWDDDIVRQLTDYIAIPAKSPGFDRDWAQHGYIDTVLRNAAAWVEAQKVEGLTLEIVRLPGRTPVLFFEVPATKAGSTQTVLMYGHMDKQPEFNGWRNDLGPWTPKYEDGKLFGRGGADDGYAVYASIAAVQALKAQGKPHARIVGLIETCEESGSYDLLPYIDALKPRLGDVALVICLDSGAGNYDQLWLTTSLRGMASGTLKVQILTEGIHSGDASGLVPSSFRIMRQVLDRLEDSATGRLLPASFHCEVPADRLAQARATAAILGEEVYKRFPWAHADCGGSVQTALPTTTDPVAPLHRLQAQPAPAAAGGRGAGRAAAQGDAGRQRALSSPGHLRGRRRGQRLERAGDRALVRAGAAGRLAGPFRRRLRHHRPGRHHSADEHAEPRLPLGADDGLRRARPAQQRARAERIPACALCEAADGRRGGGDGPAALSAARIPHPGDGRRPGPEANIPPAMQQEPSDSTLSTFTASDGDNLAVQDWPLPDDRPPRGVVLLVHGLGEHAGRYDHVARRLNGWGFAVRGYDQYGHGESGGVRGALPARTRLLDDLADLIESSRARVRPGTPLLLLGHSMGGLVLRSALHQAPGAAWAQAVSHLLCLGSPHLGAPLERAGRGVDLLLGAAPYAAPLARLGKVRSAGITDLRHGRLLDSSAVDRAPRAAVPLPTGMACHALAGTLGARAAAKTRLLGDGLVPLNSALGLHRNPALCLNFPAAHQHVFEGLGHIELLGSAAVGQRLVEIAAR